MNSRIITIISNIYTRAVRVVAVVAVVAVVGVDGGDGWGDVDVLAVVAAERGVDVEGAAEAVLDVFRYH